MSLAESQFTAVVTTGIYCRAGVQGAPAAAQHAPVHVRGRGRGRRLPSVLALPARSRTRAGMGRRAGARVPCAASASSTARSTAPPRTISRSRLGVSARHLRRLFADHIGATPSEVARSRRAHFARRLLDDTDLPMTKIAAAAGFQSVRHMNRVVKQVFRFTPRELRARRRDPSRLVVDGGLSCGSRTGRRSRGTRCSSSSHRARSPVSSTSTSTRASTGARSRSTAHRA